LAGFEAAGCRLSPMTEVLLLIKRFATFNPKSPQPAINVVI